MDSLYRAMVGRVDSIFSKDIEKFDSALRAEIGCSRFLVIGGGGTIGQAVSKEIIARQPKCLHVVDISENNLVELVRDVRSSLGHNAGDFRTFALDCGSVEFERMFNVMGPYDYVLNLSALKHVRSEQDSFTLMRLIQTNILNTIKTLEMAASAGAKKYFCVSTDKAANPVNMMGASKRIMELFLASRANRLSISTARFANVVFSDGSLLHGFRMRIEKQQPIVAPSDVKRYFVTPQESGQLCLLSCILGETGDIFFPKLTPSLDLTNFSDLAMEYLHYRGFEAEICDSEETAREKAQSWTKGQPWPCLFAPSDTTGEKPFEEFYTQGEAVNMSSYEGLGVVKLNDVSNNMELENFLKNLTLLRSSADWEKNDLVNLFQTLLPDFEHVELGRYLNDKM